MRYREAVHLHYEDEVTVKESGAVKVVVETEVSDKDVFIRCNDGNLYHHTAVK